MSCFAVCVDGCEMGGRLKHSTCRQPVTLLLSPRVQSSGGGRASGTRPGAAEEEVREAAEREVSDAVILFINHLPPNLPERPQLKDKTGTAGCLVLFRLVLSQQQEDTLARAVNTGGYIGKRTHQYEVATCLHWRPRCSKTRVRKRQPCLD